TGEFENLDSLSNVNVNFIGSDKAVLLKDIAKVSEGLEEETTRGFLNGKPALYLEIYKQSGANTVQVVDKVKRRIGEVNQFLETRKVDAKVELVRDGSYVIRNNITDVYESIIIGAVLCIIVVFFFLGSGRSTFITGLALPNSLLGAFVLMYASGFTINIMTLLALSLAVGLLIDDAIVVRENIFRYLEMGESPMVAARKGTMEVAQAVVATTFVVIAVFGPIAFLDGIVGQFFKQFGLTIVFAMLISMFDAFTMAPMMSAYLASANEHVKGKGPIAKMLAGFDRFQTWLENKYVAVLRVGLKKPWMILVTAFFLFVGSIVLMKFLPSTFLPTPDNGEFEVQVETPIGSSLDKTSELATKVEEVVRSHSAVSLVSKVVGTRLSESNKANMYIQLVPRKNRKQSTGEVKTDMREKLASFQSEGIVLVTDVDISGGNQKPFNLVVRGQNLEELAPYVDKLVGEMAKIPGLVDVDTNFRTGAPEFQVAFDRVRAEEVGVSTGTAGAELRARVEGTTPAVYRIEGREYDIRVRMRAEDRDLRKEFDTTFVPNTNGNMIPLKSVAAKKEVVGYSQINRQNKGRYIMITGNLDSKQGNLGDITKATEVLLKTMPPPVGVEASFLGQAQDLQDLQRNMMMAIILGVIFIYLVLASLYESFVTPYTILLALPLAICGAVIALFISGKGLDIFSLIGVVMLLGVVAKNSILLVDYANKLIEDEGKTIYDALLIACKTRLRPILMTSFALIAGMIPIAIGLNEASAQRTSMGIAIIGGLISSTVLTLLVVPAAFEYMYRFGQWVNRMFNKVRGQTAPKHKEEEEKEQIPEGLLSK
ncbi:MAG: efflux RND transporter permease subunit, partial [Pseudobdellovibrionaceae bacterium]